MTLALNLAQAVNCLGGQPPCGECRPCRRIAAGKHADVQVIGLSSEEKMDIGIDQIREMQAATALPPYEGRRKVFIIDRAEHLSLEAANCLLKTLEEPPPHVLLLLLTARERALLPTIVSRCQRVELRPLPLALVEQALLELKGVSPPQAALLARLSGGCLGWAIAAVEQEELLREREEKLTRLIRLSTAGQEELLEFAATLAAQFSRHRESVYEVLDLWRSWWRDLLLLRGGGAAFITNIDRESELLRQAGDYTLEQIKTFIRCLEAAREQLERNANPRLVLEVLLLHLPGAALLSPTAGIN
jgi:DNA polymerase-3 subunit delta'